jgi:hypothetical protein
VVTPKGGEASPDRLMTFRLHLFWAAVLISSLIASVFLGHTHTAMRTWAVLALVISLAPVAIWLWTSRQERLADRPPTSAVAHQDTEPDTGGEPQPAFATTTTGGN